MIFIKYEIERNDFCGLTLESIKSHNFKTIIAYHGVFDFCCSQALATDVDDVIHPSRNSVVSVLVS